MPVMNGYDATKAIRRSSHEAAKKIPIIAMSANAFSEDIQNSLAAGMNAHISKPVEMKVLEKTIRRQRGKLRTGGRQASYDFYDRASFSSTGNPCRNHPCDRTYYW